MSSEQVLVEAPSGRIVGILNKLVRWRPQAGFLVLTVTLVLASLMTVGFVRTQRAVTVIINGRVHQWRTHQTSVAALLEEAGLEIAEEDIVLPGLDASLTGLGRVTVYKAKPVTVEVDGRVIEHRTHTGTVGDLLRELGVVIRGYDRMLFNGLEAQESTLLANPGDDPSSQRIVVRRAVPVHVNDDGAAFTIYTIASTVGEALRAEDILLYLGDRIRPSLGNPIAAGLRIFIRRSKPITILVDGRTIKTRTQRNTVAEALPYEGVILRGKDYTRPAKTTEISDNMTVQVVRVREEIFVEQEPIPFETVWRPEDELELDQQQIDQRGEEGVKKRRIRIVYENGQETKRVMEKEWVDLEPVTRIIAYGRKIVIREAETPEGTIRYWRKMRALATSYTAATSGKARDHPQYGITYMGLQAGKGIVAVDPRVINLGSKMYVPGYGMALAGDTGGRIKGRRIDLGYDEDNLKLWYQWVDVYLLEPVPPLDEIRWVLPSWPVERRTRR